MKVLIIGSGGREHAMAWKVAQSPQVTQVFVAPGNGGTKLEPGVENVPVAATDIDNLIAFVQRHQIDLTIVGPEAPLAAGIVDRFQEQQLACFGPTQQAAQLESSKAFSKDFMQRHHIPTASYACFSNVDEALAYLQDQPFPLVIKADGLAAGKGVIIAEDYSQAAATVHDMLAGNRFGDAGRRVVIEEFLSGEEASFIVMVDGEHVVPFASSQDHKARDNGDRGPNTGGMGAYSPAPVVTPQVYQHIMNDIVLPTVRGMQADGIPFTGFLYVGAMIDSHGQAKVLEYNCRMGDPETQPILLRLQSDLVALCQAAIEQKLDTMTVQWSPKPALGVVLCAGGYPDDYQKGDVIAELPHPENHQQKIFHAGTLIKNGQLVTNGGRVLCVTTLADSVSDAQQKAHELITKISWDNMYYRTDIGHRAITREQRNFRK